MPPPPISIAVGQLWKIGANELLRVALVDGEQIEGSLLDTTAHTTAWWVGRRAYFESYELQGFVRVGRPD